MRAMASKSDKTTGLKIGWWITWATIFNGDSTITSAVLDRLLHHAETVLIEGSSYRMKDRIES
jgi:hypothetical protein